MTTSYQISATPYQITSGSVACTSRGLWVPAVQFLLVEMTLVAKSSYLLVIAVCLSVGCNAVSYNVSFIAVFVLSTPVLYLLFKFHTTKLPHYPYEKALAFFEKTNGGVVAHRGGTPENTLAAFSKAKSQGANGVEVDISLTKDGHAVLLHDVTVDRTSNGKGRIDELTLEEAKELDFGSHCG